MTIPTNEEILKILDEFKFKCADDIETKFLEFKPWNGPKASMKEAIEYAVCFANAEGGVIVFGVADGKCGRDKVIHGAENYNLDVWRRGVFEATHPHLNVEVSEIDVSEGTGKLLIVRIPKGDSPPYGTSQGIFKQRVGKNCMPLDQALYARTRIATGAVDWSGEPAMGVKMIDLDPIEIARARNILRRFNSESELLKLADEPFLAALGALKGRCVTHAGLLLFGKDGTIREYCPQHQVHYVFQTSDVSVSRNDSYRCSLLNVIERVEQIFSSPVNPEQELSVGLFKLRIPAYPLEVVREASLNAMTHRDYSDPGEILIRHTRKELVITSPGGFIAGITPDNILRHEPISRNRTLAEAFEKLRLVERAGIGRRRIFLPLLSYGKQPPEYETDGTQVTLRIFNGSYDARMAQLVAKWKRDGIEIDLDGLLVLFYLKEHSFIDSSRASQILQLPHDEVKRVLEILTRSPTALLERRGRTKSVTYHLAKPIASDLLGRVFYSRSKDIDRLRYTEMITVYLKDHDSITPKQCRELLVLGESNTARVEISQLLKKWSGPDGFLDREGKPPKVVYFLRKRTDKAEPVLEKC